MKNAIVPNVKQGGPLGVLRFAWNLPLMARLFTRLFRDPRVGRLPKALLIGALLYVLLPFDFLSDFLPLIGLADDVTLLLAAAQAFLALSPRAVVDEKLREIRGR
jgi:uncharacterized membrane protein YkvA (DUF1232 family)